MNLLKYLIPCLLLLTMVSIEIFRNVGMMRIECAETEIVKEMEEDNVKEEGERKTEELKLKEQLTTEDFRYCCMLREQSGKQIVGTHDLNYELPITKAVFSPPEFCFS